MSFDFVNYMKNIATSLKELLDTEEHKHFNRITSLLGLEEFLSNSHIVEGYQLLVLDKINGRLADNSNSDNLLDRRLFTFYIFKNVQHYNFDQHQTAIQGCLSVAKKIESKMLKDKRDAANGLQYLDRSFYYDTIGPFAQGWHGIMINFSVLDNAGIIYNPDDWQ